MPDPSSSPCPRSNCPPSTCCAAPSSRGRAVGARCLHSRTPARGIGLTPAKRISGGDGLSRQCRSTTPCGRAPRCHRGRDRRHRPRAGALPRRRQHRRDCAARDATRMPRRRRRTSARWREREPGADGAKSTESRWNSVDAAAGMVLAAAEEMGAPLRGHAAQRRRGGRLTSNSIRRRRRGGVAEQPPGHFQLANQLLPAMAESAGDADDARRHRQFLVDTGFRRSLDLDVTWERRKFDASIVPARRAGEPALRAGPRRARHPSPRFKSLAVHPGVVATEPPPRLLARDRDRDRRRCSASSTTRRSASSSARRAMAAARRCTRCSRRPCPTARTSRLRADGHEPGEQGAAHEGSFCGSGRLTGTAARARHRRDADEAARHVRHECALAGA